MAHSAPTPAAVLSIFDTLAPPGTPLTTTEVAVEFTCTQRTIYNKLERLVEAGDLKTKKVGARGRVWWRPAAHDAPPQPGPIPAPTNPTALEAATEALRESEERLRLALSAADLGVWEFDLQTDKPTIHSPQHDRIYGYEDPLDDWSYEQFLDHVHPADRAYVRERFGAAFETGELVLECRIIRTDESQRWIAALGKFYVDDAGELTRAVGTIRDITERKDRERELERVAGIIDALGEPVYALDDRGRFTFVNEAFIELSGYSESELLGEHVSIGMDEDTIAQTESRIAAHLASGCGGNLTLEYAVTTKDGERVPVENRLSILTDEDGRPRGSAGVLWDVSEREERERELEAAKTHYQTLVENVPNGAVALVDEDLRYVTVGGTPIEEANATVAELEGTPLVDGLPPKIADLLVPRYAAALTGEKSEFEVALGDGVYQFRILPVRADNGDVFAAMGMSQDVTDRKERERQLEEFHNWTETLMENFPAGAVALVDRNFRYVTFGGTVEGKPELSGATLEGEPIREVLPQEVADVVVPRYEAAFEGEAAAFEDTIGNRTYQFHFVPVRDDEGDVFAVTATSQDITHRIERERDLARFKQAVEASGHAIYMTDRTGDITFVNSSFETVTGYTAADAIGRTPRLLQSGRHGDAYYRDLWETILDGDVWEEEIIDRRKNGEYFYAEQTIAPVTNSGGEIVQFVAVLRDISSRKRHEAQLTALNHLNEIVQELTHLILESSTREEIEQAVCDRLTDSESYAFAWIGHLDRYGQRITPMAGLGDEDNSAERSISIAVDDPERAGPMGQAVQTGGVHVATGSNTDPVFERWNRLNAECISKRVSIPVTFEEQVYGVLNIYTAREHAFDAREQQIISQLGTVVGHAIKSLERKRALLEDHVYEVTMYSETLAQAFTGVGDDEITVAIDRTIPLPTGETITYYSADGIDPERFIDLVQEFHPDVDIRLINQIGTRSRLELTTTDETLAATLATYGGRIVEPILQDGDFRVVVQLPQGTDIRQFKEAVTRAFPDMEFIAQTQSSRQTQTIEDVVTRIDEQLTERQRTALEVAFHSGFFNWPRDTTGEELADLLGVTASTIHHHLRHAEQKLIAASVGTGKPPDA